jgi:hypothetical protein
VSYDDVLDPFEDLLNFSRITHDFKKFILNDLKLETGSILMNKQTFRIWFNSEDLIYVDFDEENLFTVVEIVEEDEEIKLQCLNQNKVIEIDAFLFFLNWGNFTNLPDLFNFYFEKVL